MKIAHYRIEVFLNDGQYVPKAGEINDLLLRSANVNFHKSMVYPDYINGDSHILEYVAKENIHVTKGEVQP